MDQLAVVGRASPDAVSMALQVTKTYEENDPDDIKKGADPPQKLWIVEGFASRGGVDHQGDEITLAAMHSALTSLDENTTVLYNHIQDRPIGCLLGKKVDEAANGLWVRCSISKSEPDIWQKLCDKTLNKFSIWGRVQDAARVKRADGTIGREIRRMYLHEVSVVSVAGNSFANVTDIQKSLGVSKSSSVISCLFCAATSPLEEFHSGDTADGKEWMCADCGHSYDYDRLLFSDVGEEVYAYPLISKARWTRAYISKLPDSCFAAIEPAYKNGDTKDKNARHLPFKDDKGKLDLAHYNNAWARVNQIKPVTDSISKEALIKMAKRTLNRYRAEADKLREKKKSLDGDIGKKGVWPDSNIPYLKTPEEYDAAYSDLSTDERAEMLTPAQYNNYYAECQENYEKWGSLQDQEQNSSSEGSGESSESNSNEEILSKKEDAEMEKVTEALQAMIALQKEQMEQQKVSMDSLKTSFDTLCAQITKPKEAEKVVETPKEEPVAKNEAEISKENKILEELLAQQARQVEQMAALEKTLTEKFAAKKEEEVVPPPVEEPVKKAVDLDKVMEDMRKVLSPTYSKSDAIAKIFLKVAEMKEAGHFDDKRDIL